MQAAHLNFAAELMEHEQVIRDTRASLQAPFENLAAAAIASLKAGGKLLMFGNGGSAADAQHLAAELVVRYRDNRAALAAVALTTDTSVLTAIGNDFGFDELFSRQIAALGRKGDMAIGFSTSGQSPNVLLALKTARDMGLITACFGGGNGGSLRDVSDHLLIVPSSVTARIQEVHITLGHMLCLAIEAALGNSPND